MAVLQWQLATPTSSWSACLQTSHACPRPPCEVAVWAWFVAPSRDLLLWCRYPGRWQQLEEEVHPLSSLKGANSIMTSRHGSIFRITGPFCVEFTGHWCINLARSRTVEWIFLDLFVVSLKELLNKQSSCWWFGTPQWSCNITEMIRS